MSDLNSYVLVKINRTVKEEAMAYAKNHGSTISAYIRDFLDGVNSGRIKPLVKFRFENGLSPGTYALVPIVGEKRQ